MKRVQEIKTKREAQFIRNRLNATKDKELQADLKEIELDVGLLQNPPVSRKMARQKVEGKKQKKDAAAAAMELWSPGFLLFVCPVYAHYVSLYEYPL